MYKRLVIYSLVILSFSCSKSENVKKSSTEWEKIPLKYATGFSIEQSGDNYRVTVNRPFKDAKQGYTYIFSTNSQPDNEPANNNNIEIPIKSIVCTSTTHIPLLDYLNESDALIGFPTLDYISSKSMRKLINSGKVSELGIDEALNLEKVIELRPDVVMGYSLNGDLGQFDLIEETGIPVLLNAEYIETHPLGRAEWIKFAGILFNKLALADSVFNEIEQEYLTVASRVKGSDLQPTTLSGVVYGDSWYLPGGRNYASTLLRDSGFKFFWETDTTAAFLPLSFEKVFDQARESDFWIGVASYTSLSEIAQADQRYTAFEAYKNGHIYSYNKRIGEKGGSEFLELGYLRPDLILKDLVKIGHPELLPEHELFFHFKLP